MNVTARNLGRVAYAQTLDAMQTFTRTRTVDAPDELWAVQHTAVFTQGKAGKPQHVLAAGDIPVVQSDRGGQVTYHGPGQQVVYVLVNVRRLGIGPRELVRRLEAGAIACLDTLGIEAARRPGAPGVYVGEAKIAALGLRISNGFSYHGIALNVGMDLEPFSRINPCGYADLKVTQVADLGGPDNPDEVMPGFVRELAQCLYEGQPVQVNWAPAATSAAA